MIRDLTLQIGEDIALNGLTNGGKVGKIVELGPQERYVQPFCVVMMNKAAEGGTSFGVKLQTSDTITNAGKDDEALESPVDLFAIAPVATADMVTGKEIAIFRMPFGAKRYIGFAGQVEGTFTAGSVDIVFTNDVAKWTPVQ